MDLASGESLESSVTHAAYVWPALMHGMRLLGMPPLSCSARASKVTQTFAFGRCASGEHRTLGQCPRSRVCAARCDPSARRRGVGDDCAALFLV